MACGLCKVRKPRYGELIPADETLNRGDLFGGSLCLSLKKVGPGQLPVNRIEAKHCCPHMVKDSPANPGPIVKSCDEQLPQSAARLSNPSPPANRSRSLLISSSKQLTILALVVGRQPQCRAKLSDKATILPARSFGLLVHPSIHGALQVAGQGLQAGGRGRPRPGQRRALHQPHRQRSVLCSNNSVQTSEFVWHSEQSRAWRR
jgi:hypothetical protein